MISQPTPATMHQPQWHTQPQAAQLVARWVDHMAMQCEPILKLSNRLLTDTGTRLIDWIDHLVIPKSPDNLQHLQAAGFTPTQDSGKQAWRHPDGIFLTFVPHHVPPLALAIKVESVEGYLHANHLPGELAEGSRFCSLRRARIASGDGVELWVIERHGNPGFDPVEPTEKEAHLIHVHREAFLARRRQFRGRQFEEDAEGFTHTAELIDAAVRDLGAARASDLFFIAERSYWQHRNHAAQVQRARQDALGLGWANHDHHTYRSSRAHFVRLIDLFERLGMVCRERFYAGREAGWGAQILEQPMSGIVVFADVDLAPDEVTGDFAHEPLPEIASRGTVGLWCALHGESMLQAGMHHLECQFDFDAARAQLAEAGVRTMPPFTDLPHLKQAFTEGEIWSIDPRRIDAARQAGFITDEQAQRFTRDGALGSHLEILQRDDGYKGFNPAGINSIIQATDPRRGVLREAGA